MLHAREAARRNKHANAVNISLRLALGVWCLTGTCPSACQSFAWSPVVYSFFFISATNPILNHIWMRMKHVGVDSHHPNFQLKTGCLDFRRHPPHTSLGPVLPYPHVLAEHCTHVYQHTSHREPTVVPGSHANSPRRRRRINFRSPVQQPRGVCEFASMSLGLLVLIIPV